MDAKLLSTSTAWGPGTTARPRCLLPTSPRQWLPHPPPPAPRGVGCARSARGWKHQRDVLVVGWETALRRVRWVGNPNPDKELGFKEAHLESVLFFWIGWIWFPDIQYIFVKIKSQFLFFRMSKTHMFALSQASFSPTHIHNHHHHGSNNNDNNLLY